MRLAVKQPHKRTKLHQNTVWIVEIAQKTAKISVLICLPMSMTLSLYQITYPENTVIPKDFVN